MPNNNPPPATQPDEAEAVEAVKKWTVEGHSAQDVVDAIAEQFPAARPERVIALVAAELAADAEPDPDMIRGWTINAYREIYRRALEVGAFPAALRAIDKLWGIAKRRPPPPM